jgi:hypothetical protein
MNILTRPPKHRALLPLWGLLLFGATVFAAEIAYACWLPIEKLPGRQRGWAFNAVAIHLLFGSYAKAIAPVAAAIALTLVVVAGFLAAKANGETFWDTKSDVPAWIFKVSTIVAVLGYAVVGFVALSRPSGDNDGVPKGSPRILAILWATCTLYAANYAVWRLVKSRFVKIAWWSSMAIVIIVLLSNLGTK